MSRHSPDTHQSGKESLNPEAEPWDLVVCPESSLLSMRLGEIWRYRDLLLLFVHRDIVSFYKQSVLGPLWFLIQPILTTLTYILIFGQIAGLSTDGLPQLLFYMCGITFWNYFAECLNRTSSVFRDNAHLFGKVYFPRVISPISIVLSSLVRFVIQFALFLCFWGWYFATGEIRPNAAILLFPLLIVIMASLGLGMGMLLSAMTTKYRDLVFLLQFGVQLLMYATPVIYPSSQVSGRIAAVLRWNPLTSIFETVRYGFLGAGDFAGLDLLYSATFSAIVFLFATVVFNRVERTFMDTI